MSDKPQTTHREPPPTRARALHREPQAILVRAPNWVGDVVMATPGFRALRAAHPQAHIAVHLRPELVPLLRGAPWFDELLPLIPAAGPLAPWRAGAAVRSHRPQGFDLGICIPDSFSSALVMRAAGARCVAGFKRGGRGILLHRPVSSPPEWGRRRWVARERFVLELLGALGCPPDGTHLELFTTPEEEHQADEALAASKTALPTVLQKGRFVALAPGASFGPAKCWPVESFAAVGDAAARAGAGVVVIGSAGEAELVSRVVDAMREPSLGLAGRLDLGGAKALLRRAALLVCNDSGARHIATAFGVPSLVLLGPTSLLKTDCNLEQVRAYTAGVDCSPCYRRECPIDHRCMTRISPDRVLADALPLLRQAAERE